MSKSLGNVINPFDIVDKFGTDALRYVLLRHTSAFEDSDLTLEAIHEHYTAHLTNGLGNLVARVMKLAETNLPEPIAVYTPSFPQVCTDAINAFQFNTTMDFIWSEIQTLDERITREKPFAIVQENPEQGRAFISEMVTKVSEIAYALQPFMPSTSETILTAIVANKKPENLFPRI